jgi:shikimate dehydrogenase
VVPAARTGAVLGHPIAHSLSPALHGAAYRALGLDFGYTAIDVTAAQLPAFMDRVRAEPGWYGLSVTMPLKAAMVPLLDSLNGEAAALAVVNTVTFGTADGAVALTGHNTDVAGLVNALRHGGVAERPTAAVLGGGGTATAAVAALAALGAYSVDLYVRNPENARPLAAVAERAGVACAVMDFPLAAAALGGYDAVISTLPPRGADALAAALPPSPVIPGALLLDAAYDPWPSAIAAAWQERGGRPVSGVEMLLYQAVDQVRLFTGSAGVGADVINVMCDATGLPRR